MPIAESALVDFTTVGEANGTVHGPFLIPDWEAVRVTIANNTVAGFDITILWTTEAVNPLSTILKDEITVAPSLALPTTVISDTFIPVRGRYMTIIMNTIQGPGIIGYRMQVWPGDFNAGTSSFNIGALIDSHLLNGTGGPGTLPSLNEFYDVSSYSGIIITCQPSGAPGPWAALELNILAEFFDPLGNAMSRTFFPGTTGGRISTNVNGMTSTYLKCLGPSMQIINDIVSKPLGMNALIQIWGVNYPARFDGPYTPNMEGAVLVGGATAALGQFAFEDHVINPQYAGPANVYARGGAAASGNLVLPVLIRVIDSAELASAPGIAGGIAGPVFGSIWIPPVPCTLRVYNLAAGAQLVNYALMAA